MSNDIPPCIGIADPLLFRVLNDPLPILQIIVTKSFRERDHIALDLT
jgi:hypothetical protein